MCEYCKDNKKIFEHESLDSWVIGWPDGVINSENAQYTTEMLFIDRGFIRFVASDDSQCMEHGEKIKINFCPFCGEKLEQY